MSDCFGFMGRTKKQTGRKTKDTSNNLSDQKQHSETKDCSGACHSAVQVQDTRTEVKSKPDLTMQQAAAHPNSGQQNVLTILRTISSRFYPNGGTPGNDKLLPEEYEALGVILNGVDHAVLALKESKRRKSFMLQPLFQALSVITTSGDEDVFLNTAAPSSTGPNLTMQMFYQPPYDESGPSSNYSLVWIFKPKKTSSILPFVNPSLQDSTGPLGSGANGVSAGQGSGIISRNHYGAIKDGQPYAISNYIAPKAFLQVVPSGITDILDVQFSGEGEGADIYFKTEINGKGSALDVKWAMWTVIKVQGEEKFYYLLPYGFKKDVKGEDRKIYATQMSKERGDTSTEPPKDAFVWRFNTKDFKVNDPHPISPEAQPWPPLDCNYS